MSYVSLLSRPALSRPLSYETLVWLLLVVTCGDSSTMSQAEVPLEWIHVIYGKWVCSFLPLLFENQKQRGLNLETGGMSAREIYMYI